MLQLCTPFSVSRSRVGDSLPWFYIDFYLLPVSGWIEIFQVKLYSVYNVTLVAKDRLTITVTEMEAMMKSAIRAIIFPLLSTLFFLALVLSLHTLYEPFNPSNATPIPLEITINREASLEIAPESISAMK
jgi:hypothetical protein